ncbi:MAG: hypothetical protein LBF13_00610 [Campylobacteraceae bacterium]|nr:hypothetical protein [Campylobacteraceae bacterium]
MSDINFGQEKHLESTNDYFFCAVFTFYKNAPLYKLCGIPAQAKKYLFSHLAHTAIYFLLSVRFVQTAAAMSRFVAEKIACTAAAIYENFQKKRIALCRFLSKNAKIHSDNLSYIIAFKREFLKKTHITKVWEKCKNAVKAQKTYMLMKIKKAYK